MENNNEDQANGYASYPNLEEQVKENGESEKFSMEAGPTTPQRQISSPQPQDSVQETNFDFWKVNSYKKTVRRVDDGAKMADDFMKMVGERAEIENQYCLKLQGWSKKWSELISKGPEYGSCKSSMLEFTQEAQKLAVIHCELQNQLINNVHNILTSWKTENYHKSLLSWKETKNAEESFSKAQKPWAKKYDKVMKCKKSYYAACRARDQAEKLYNNSTAESSNVTEEQTNKLKDKLTRAEGDVSSTQSKYKESVRDITNYNPKYKEDMVFVFDKLQVTEEKRKQFVKETMRSLCKYLDPGQFFERLANLYDHLAHAIEKFNPADDVSWWSAAYGKDMPVTWLEYEEYDPAAVDTITTQDTVKSDKGDAKPNGKSTVCATL